MRNVIYLLFHLLTTLAKLTRPGGSRAVMAENLLLKQQLIIHSRSRQRAPHPRMILLSDLCNEHIRRLRKALLRSLLLKYCTWL